MKLLEKEQDVTSSEEFVEYSFGIKQSGFAHILNILRNQLYSDKLTAILREYGCNAYDSHVASGIEKEPFLVSLPTRWNPTLSIRDFGAGLSESQIADLFTQYGESTKRDCNKQTGQLGIGCKSGFSYGDSFMVVSRKDGKKIQYNAYLDESHIGKVAKMLEEPLQDNDRNGLEISIPIRTNDVGLVNNKAHSVFKYFATPPTVMEDKTPVEIPSYKTKLNKEPNGWYWIKDYTGSAYVVMGNIGYHLHLDSIPGLTQDHKTFLLNYIVMEFPMGSLNFSASREALEYTEVTQKNILARVIKIYNAYKDTIQVSFEKAKDLAEAKTLLISLNSRVLAPMGNYRDLNYTWKGIPLTSYYFETIEGVTVSRYSVDNQGDEAPNKPYIKDNKGNYRAITLNARIYHNEKSRNSSSISPVGTVFIIQDMVGKIPMGSVSRKLLKLYSDTELPYLCVIKFRDNEVKKEFYENNYFDKVTTYDFSSLAEIPTTKGVKKAKKTTTRGWIWNNRYFYKCEISNEEAVVYCVGGEEGYITLNGKSVSNYFLQDVDLTHRLLNILPPQKIYKIGRKTKPKSKWIPLETFYKQKISTDKSLTSKIKNGKYITSHGSQYNLGNIDALLRSRVCLEAKIPLIEKLRELKKDVVILDPWAQEIIGNIGLAIDSQKLKANSELEQLVKTVYNQYPMLLLVSYNVDSQEIVNYITQIDKLKEYEKKYPTN